jgi:phosphate transport system permease protein
MVPSHQAKQKARKLALREALAAKGRIKVLGLTLDDYIKYFFGGNAFTAIVVLTLIMIFLFKEGAEFFPDNRSSLQLYRRAGLEFVDYADAEIDAFTALNRDLSSLRLELSDRLTLEGRTLEEANAALADFDRFAAAFAGAVAPSRALVDSWKEQVLALKESQIDNENFAIAARLARASGDEAAAKEHEAAMVPVDFAAMEAKLKNAGNLGRYRALNGEMEAYLLKLLAEVRVGSPKAAPEDASAPGNAAAPVEGIMPEISGDGASTAASTFSPILRAETQAAMESSSEPAEAEEEARIPALKPWKGPFHLPLEGKEAKFEAFKQEVAGYFQTLPETYADMEAWKGERPITFLESLGSFFFGTRWLTNSFWQDFYGIIPLFVGSLLISVVALVIAVPFSLAAGIYINQLASKPEQHIVKPYIEFIGAIPSVVLGFFGIAVLGTALRAVSHWEWLAWVPGFPMSERLNILTAGVLLAFMAIPTIFTLVEDALNNVPRYFVEASYALGANKIQTIFRIMVPAALSGIIAAVLLGFGRVIGETMVVLLCAGNRIVVPDIMEGLGIFFQPTHTMTGIIAQEMGEVDQGSLHYRALFMIGMMLFVISLGLNFLAQQVVKRFRIGD